MTMRMSGGSIAGVTSNPVFTLQVRFTFICLRNNYKTTTPEMQLMVTVPSSPMIACVWERMIKGTIGGVTSNPVFTLQVHVTLIFWRYDCNYFGI